MKRNMSIARWDSHITLVAVFSLVRCSYFASRYKSFSSTFSFSTIQFYFNYEVDCLAQNIVVTGAPTAIVSETYRKYEFSGQEYFCKADASQENELWNQMQGNCSLDYFQLLILLRYELMKSSFTFLPIILYL